MLPAFLKALAALVRRLAAEGGAIHVTEADAVELEMLAGLTWVDAPWVGRALHEVVADAQKLPIEQVGVRTPIAPADIAHAWLRLSLAIVAESSEIRFDWQCERAAVCAELAVLSGTWSGMKSNAHVTRLPTMGAVFADPHQGTREGARAAWNFVVESLTNGADREARELDREGAADRVLSLVNLADRYRRELEAMA